MRTLAVAILCVVVFTSLFSQQPPNKPSPRTVAPLASGTIADSVYRNSQLGITYKIIFGWVDRTEQIRTNQDKSSTGQVLLQVFEHPPEVKGEGINSAAIIAAESLSAYPGVKTAADYLGPLIEAVTSQGFKVVNEPYQANIGAKSLVRGDFSREVSGFTMHQSSLVMLSKGYAVSFTFIGSSEDEVQRLIERLSFAAGKAGTKPLL